MTGSTSAASAAAIRAGQRVHERRSAVRRGPRKPNQHRRRMPRRAPHVLSAPYPCCMPSGPRLGCRTQRKPAHSAGGGQGGWRRPAQGWRWQRRQRNGRGGSAPGEGRPLGRLPCLVITIRSRRVAGAASRREQQARTRFAYRCTCSKLPSRAPKPPKLPSCTQCTPAHLASAAPGQSSDMNSLCGEAAGSQECQHLFSSGLDR